MSNEEIEIGVGDHISQSARFKVTDMMKESTRQRIEGMRTTVNNRTQYLKRRYGCEFESNLVDAVTADRTFIVVTFIATRVK